MGSHEPLGAVEIPLQLFWDNRTHDQWFKIFPVGSTPGGDGNASGSIRLNFRVLAANTPFTALKLGSGVVAEGRMSKLKRVRGDWWTGDPAEGEKALVEMCVG